MGIDYAKNPLVKKFIELNADENKPKNIFLYAGGGYGKTTAMLCLFKYLLEKALNGENIVPIYIDVKLMEYDTQNPIINYIYSEYSGNDTDESMVENLFSNQAPTFSKKYTYYIFIDGLNETNDCNKNKLKDKISKLAKYSFVKLIVSSRIQEVFDKASFCVFELQKLDEEQIKDYLDKNFGEKYNEQTKVKEINKSLIEILQIPMFMKVFSKTYNKKSPDIYDERTVRKADVLDSYVQKILKELKERTNSYDNSILEFVINFYLPALAFQMAEENVLDIDSEIVDKKLCLNYFVTFFRGTKKKKIELLIKSAKFAPEIVCIENFALINDNDGNYSFVHQIWRDFFAAKHIINCMNAEKLDELEISVDENIRQFVGELVREYVDQYKYSRKPAYKLDHKNGKAKFVDDPDSRRCECDFEKKDNLDTWSESPIEHFMHQHNMNSTKPISPLVIRNLVEIMKISRNNHISANYSELDLTNANFCATSCCNSSFKGSRINSSTFSSYLDNISMDFVSISADNKLIIIVDEVIAKSIVLDINTGAVIKNFDYLDWRDDYCLYDRKPIFLYEDDYAHDYEIIETIQYENCIYKIYFEEISNRVDYYDNFDVEIIEDSTFVLTNHGNTTIKTAYYDNNVSVISFSGDGNRLISGNEQGVINIWKIESSKNVYEPLYSLVTDSEVKSISISDDNSYMITVHKNGEIIVWDYGSLKIKNIYARRSFPILNSYFIDKNNNCIVLCYCEYGNHLIVLIYDLKQKRIVKGFDKSINGYYVVSSITNKCAYIDNKGIIHIFDYISNGEITIKPNNSMILKESYIRSFSPDGRYILLKNVYFEDENMTIEKYLIYDLNLRKCVFVLNEDDCVTFDSSFYFVNGEWKTFTDNAKASISVDDEYATFLFQYKNDHYLAFENAENQIFETIGFIIPAIIIGSNFQNVDLRVNNEKEYLKTLLINGGAVDKSFDINIDYNNLQIQLRKNIRFNTELVNVFTDNIKENHIKKYVLSEYFEDNKMHNQHCHFILNKLGRIFGCDIVYYYDDVLFVIDNFHFQIYYLSPDLKILYRSIEYYFSSNELVFVATGEKNYIVTFSLDLKQFRLIHIHKKYINLFIYDYLLHTNFIEIRNFCVDNGIEYLYGSNLKELSFYVFEIINNKCIELIVQKLELDYFINIYIEESHAYFIEKKEDGLFNIETIISNSKIEHEYTFKITDVYLENKEKTTYYLTLKGEKYKHFFACKDRFFYKEIRFDSRKKELYFYNNQID